MARRVKPDLIQPAEHLNRNRGTCVRGGLEALGELSLTCPRHEHGLVVVQHPRPDNTLMTDLLARKTGMSTGRDGMRIEANSVYDPAELRPRCPHGTPQPQLLGRRPHLPVDHFCALAGPRHQGLASCFPALDRWHARAARDQGGRRHHDRSRPADRTIRRHAAQCHRGGLYSRALTGRHRARVDGDRQPPIRGANWPRRPSRQRLDKIFFAGRDGHDFSNYKRTTITRRLNRRMVLHKLSRIEDYVRYLGERRGKWTSCFTTS
jgi:two-component system CheB/CheR fusion protein